ncbi:NifU family protein [Haploplasma modicum]|jgi:Fe-S cluster biogenesis protein NfuA|uniref:NifU family protein n=1 Tax=Haploplasma modicum TaxID=2150 RepID=UPI00047E4143|nr:NifU family protein [Haploplasma modicum]MCR1809100.1 NifU family protein [Haploplasma modicum]
MAEMESKVLAILDKIRPYILRDGGDISLIKIESGVVYVKMSGACEGCFALDVTLKQGVEKLLLENVPGIIGVINV